MPQAVSRKQFRMMQAILHGKVDESKSSGRGTPPKSVAAKFTSPGGDAPETHGENRGGSWSEAHHTKAKAKVKEERKARKHAKKSKKELKKSFEDHYSGHAAATIVMNDNNQILLGRHSTGGMAFIKKPILGINSVKNASAPHTKAPGTFMIFKKIVASTALIIPPIIFDRIQLIQNSYLL